MLFQNLPLLLYHIFQIILHLTFALCMKAMLEMNSYFFDKQIVFSFKKVIFSKECL